MKRTLREALAETRSVTPAQLSRAMAATPWGVDDKIVFTLDGFLEFMGKWQELENKG
jgi:hypothetical protein